MSSRLATDAVLLRVVDYGESDRVVTLLTEARGKVSAFARAARRSRKRFGGALEPFAALSVELETRSRGSDDLLSLEGASIRRNFSRLRARLQALAVGGYATELVREMLPAEERAPHVLALLLALYAALDAPEEPPNGTLAVAFELEMLRAFGHEPALDRCAACGREAPADKAARLDPGRGGLVCSRCRTARTPTRALSGVTRAALSALQRGGLGAVGEVALEGRVLAEARATTAALLDPILGREPRTRGLLGALGVDR